jgi:NAD(P)H dehydrogenase (quinone)
MPSGPGTSRQTAELYPRTDAADRAIWAIRPPDCRAAVNTFPLIAFPWRRTMPAEPGTEKAGSKKGSQIMKVLIVYYSTLGNVFKMANLVAEGVSEVPGAEPVGRTVPELIPASVIDAHPGMKAGREMQKDVPLVTQDDFRQAGAIAFGTPTRFGNVSSQLKNQIDQLTSLWLKGELEGKPAGVFVSTGSLHGGQETTILTLAAPLIHLGMIFVGVPYSCPELFTTTAGGSPYGPGHVAGPTSGLPIDPKEAAICRALGRRLARIGLKLGGA